MTCPRCNGWFYRDFDGLTCALCARPLRPFVSTVPYEARNAEDILQTITRERRFIDAQVAAGRRAWS